MASGTNKYLDLSQHVGQGSRGRFGTALNATVPGATSLRRVAGPLNYYKTIMEETPMENGSSKCLTTFRAKTHLLGRTGPAATLLSWNTLPLCDHAPAGQRFHATASMTSSKNDIDILNKILSASRAPCPYDLCPLGSSYRPNDVAAHALTFN
jgi:hypothetical protein